MGVFERPGSPYWQLYLETTKEKVKTDIRIGMTTAQRKDSKQIALDLYHQKMNAIAARLYKLPTARPAIRFDKYADWYGPHIIDHRKGHRREHELLLELRRFFDDDLLTQIDRDRVAEYHTARRAKTPPISAVTINREVDLLKAMLRDAVPKYLEHSPIAGMPRLDVTPPRRRYASEEELAKLLAVCEDDQDRAVLRLGRYQLIRLGDILDLQHTDRQDDLLYIRDPKNGEPYEVALDDETLTLVEALATNGSPYLLPKFRRAENPRDWPGSVRQRVEYLCREAHVPYGRKKHGFTFHWGTRRSGATDWLMKKKRKLASVQAQGGWKKPDVLLEIYTEVSREDLRAVVGTQKRMRKRTRA